jgi:hypothetical protein
VTLAPAQRLQRGNRDQFRAAFAKNLDLLANSRFPKGMTEGKATAKAKAKEEADPYGMTARKAKTKAKALWIAGAGLIGRKST